MSEVVVKFDEPITGTNGSSYFAQAVAGERSDGLWEGWIEFLPVSDDGEALASERETTQPNRTNLEYWAQGLTRVYLEGALQRAAAAAAPAVQKPAEDDTPVFGRPANHHRAPPASAQRVRPRAILDPYSVYTQGEDVLRSELGALSRSHVESIVDAYGFSPTDSPADISAMSQQTLVDAIIRGVRSAGATDRS